MRRAQRRVASARSLLFVPGDRPERFEKALASGADLVVLDLEDAVPPDRKEQARQDVAVFVGLGDPRCIVRVNADGTPWSADDLASFARAGAAIMVPKADLEAVTAVVGRVGVQVPVLALVETARGVLDAAQLAAVPGVARLALGSVDLAAELGVSFEDRDALASARCHLVLASAAAGLPGPVDGVTLGVTNDVAVADDVAYAKRLGFTGKLCIHPVQVPVVHGALAPTPEQLEWAARVIDAAHDSEGGVVVLDGRMVDKPVVDRARAILDGEAPS